MGADDPGAYLRRLLKCQVACPNQGVASIAECLSCSAFRGWSLSSCGKTEGLRCVEGVLVYSDEDPRSDGNDPAPTK